MFKNSMKFTRAAFELTQKIATGKTARHSWYSYVVTNIRHYFAVISLKAFDAMKLHILKSLKVNGSNAPCSLSCGSFFHK